MLVVTKVQGYGFRFFVTVEKENGLKMIRDDFYIGTGNLIKELKTAISDGVINTTIGMECSYFRTIITTK